MHNERRREQRPGPIPGNPDVPIHLKRPAFAFFLHASVAKKQNSTVEVKGLGGQCVCVGPELACCVHFAGSIFLIIAFLRAFRRPSS
jgi:hypothetical protein